jgi:hypothetical protein
VRRGAGCVWDGLGRVGEAMCVVGMGLHGTGCEGWVRQCVPCSLVCVGEVGIGW